MQAIDQYADLPLGLSESSAGANFVKEQVVQRKFMADHDIKNPLMLYRNWTFNSSPLDILSLLKKLNCGTPQFVNIGRVFIAGDDLLLTCDFDHSNIDDKTDRAARFVFYGEQNAVVKAEKFLRPFALPESQYVTWAYLNGNGNLDSISLPLAVNRTPAIDEFYPFITEGVNTFCDAFKNSDASLMILFGEPGTGKTSLIKHMIRRNKYSTLIAYDEKLIGNDALFIKFLHNHDLLVLEDSDVLLQSREKYHNTVMSRFLNTSDGLASISQKKIIFTANISNLGTIDPALLRPGRCFRNQEFRRLTREETIHAAKVIGVDVPIHSDEFTLAEVFNPPNVNKSKVGFLRSIIPS